MTQEKMDMAVLTIVHRWRRKVLVQMRRALQAQMPCSRLHVGSIVVGTVARVVSYGAFITLPGGVKGLLHVADMSWTRRIGHPSEVVREGDSVRVKVIKVRPEQRRIWLALAGVIPHATRHHPTGSLG